jgi:hypothetical protein
MNVPPRIAQPILASPAVRSCKEKPFMTVLSVKDYAEVKAVGAEYHRRNPRSVML